MLSPSEFEIYLRIAREQHVHAFKVGLDGALAVEFLPNMDPGLSVAEPTSSDVAGAWKRGPDLDHDPELDTQWD